MASSNSHTLQKYDSCRTAFLCCDIQEKLADRMPRYMCAVVVSNVMATLYQSLPKGSAVFIVSEQYPQGVGPTYHGIRIPEGAPIFAKQTPSMLTPDIAPYILGDKERGLEPVQQVILWGHETQVCILNTADALLQHGIRVALAVDGCASQIPIDHEMAVLAMSSWKGLIVSTTTSIIMQLSRCDDLLRRISISLCHIMLTDWQAARDGLLKPEIKGTEEDVEKLDKKNLDTNILAASIENKQ